MANRLEFNFSQTFGGTVWSTVVVPNDNLIILEIRNELHHEVRFSALDYNRNIFLWKDISFDESWWIGLTTATSEVMLLHLYQNTENPDEKALLAWHMHDQKILWKLDNFLFTALDDGMVYGQLLKKDHALASVELLTGKIIENVSLPEAGKENILVYKPFQYVDGSEHFETVKSFLADKMKLIPVGGVEYLESLGLIFISYYIQEKGLANYLLVVTEAGNKVLNEKIDEQLKGIGLETFFLLSGCLFFVRNKTDLVSYRII